MNNVAMGSSTKLGTRTVTLMHKFRYEVFVKRLSWALDAPDGLEKDAYDTDDAGYIVVTDSSERVTASARLLPTTQRYMLPELFPELLGGNSPPRGSAVWELSRFATSVRETRDGRVLSLSEQTLDLLGLVFDFARDHGIARLLLVTNIGIERLMLRAGLDAHRMAPPATVGGKLCVALLIDVPTFARAAISAEAAGVAKQLDRCA